MHYGTHLDLNKLKKSTASIKSEFSFFCERILKKEYTPSVLGVKPRWVSHWEEKDLFLNGTDKGKWHSFNLVEAFWAKILLKLRKYHLPLKAIKIMRDNLIIKPDALNEKNIKQLRIVLSALAQQDGIKEPDAFAQSIDIHEALVLAKINVLELFILDMLVLRNNLRLLINADGIPIFQKPGFEDLYSDIDFIKNFLQGSYLSISMNEILAELVDDIGLEQATVSMLISPEEAKIIETIREEQITSIEIIKKGSPGEPFQINIKKDLKIEAASRISELITSGGYQEITIKVENGEIVHCRNIGKKRLKNVSKK